MSGGLNPVNIASQVAVGVATGGTSIIAQMAMQVVSAVGQQVIQQLGDQLGLPQPVIDGAQGVLAGAVGDTHGARQNYQEAIDGLGDAMDGLPSDIGDLQRRAEDAVNDLVRGLSEGEDFKQAKAGGKGGGWLMAMAEALGAKLNEMASEMEQMAGQISKDTPDLTAKFGALTQQFSMLFNATSNSIKTVGEGMAQAARKGG